MKTFVIKGNLCFSRSMDELVLMEHSYLVVEDGCVAGVFRALPEQYAQLPVLDYGEQLILPGMTDLHIHAPQFAFRGLGMDMELLEWLNTYTFPEESKYKELEYADRAYSSFVEHLLHSTTTRAAIFATIHVPATKLLMQKLDEAGLSCYVGKVNMNRNSPVYLREISTNQAAARHGKLALRDKRGVPECEAHPDAALYSIVYRRSHVRTGAAAGKVRCACTEPPVGELL